MYKKYIWKMCYFDGLFSLGSLCYDVQPMWSLSSYLSMPHRYQLEKLHDIADALIY